MAAQKELLELRESESQAAQDQIEVLEQQLADATR